jgi:hypothetical protein
MYLAAVDSANSIPSISNSPCIRGAPHSGFSFTHSADEVTDLTIDPRAATTLAGLLAPIGAKTAPMPPNNSLGLDQSDRIQNRGEHSLHPDQDQPIDVLEPRPRPSLAAQHDHLLRQYYVFALESGA